MPEQMCARNEEVQADSSVETLIQACLPAVRRWAHGRVPRGARGQFDTTDLVQEAALRMLQRRGLFAPRHPGAVEKYLRLTVLNMVRDQARRIASRPEIVGLEAEPPCPRTGPLLHTMREELRARYERQLAELRPKDRRLVAARLQQGLSVDDIMRRFGFRSPDAARMAVGRAVNRLMHKLSR